MLSEKAPSCTLYRDKLTGHSDDIVYYLLSIVSLGGPKSFESAMTKKQSTVIAGKLFIIPKAKLSKSGEEKYSEFFSVNIRR